jgi:hypothetical protein
VKGGLRAVQERRPRWNVVGSRAAAAHALALLITVFGGLLRLDAFVGKYGTLDHPAWARIVTHDIAPLAASMRPSSVVWGREPQPYVGGDPINYIRFAREMKGFYQAHVREPVFLALTRAGLWALGGQDAAVSLASLVGSVLAVYAAFLVASALLSPLAGVLAALLLAIEYEAITWAPDGWRDDTFTATVLFAAWALIRLRQRPSAANAVLAGGLCGISCLTRITALSFVTPALVWLVADGSAPARREKAKHAALAFGVLGIVVAPYVISCAIATGDPLYDIVLRIDPVDPESQERVSVLFNRHFVGALRLSWNPERVGSYRVRVLPHMVRSTNELTIIPGSLVAAGSAGPRFAWLDSDDRIGVRLWYVRVISVP